MIRVKLRECNKQLKLLAALSIKPARKTRLGIALFLRPLHSFPGNKIMIFLFEKVFCLRQLPEKVSTVFIYTLLQNHIKTMHIY